MATYINHNTSGFVAFRCGGCSWCMNATSTPWKLFEGIEYNNYLFGNCQFISCGFCHIVLQWGFYFKRTSWLASLSELIWNSNTPLCGVNMDIFKDVIKDYITLIWKINTWSIHIWRLSSYNFIQFQWICIIIFHWVRKQRSWYPHICFNVWKLHNFSNSSYPCKNFACHPNCFIHW